MLVAALAALAVQAPAATTVYRWTDDEGRTHYAQNVPPKYLERAKPVLTDAAGPSPDQQRQAQQRAAKERALAAAAGASSPSKGLTSKEASTRRS